MNIPVNKQTLSRLVIVTIGSFVFSFTLPLPEGTSFSDRTDLVAALLFAFTIIFLIRAAAGRRRELFSTVFIELNKLRRIYHIGRNLSQTAPRLRSWFTDLHGHLCAYMSEFSDRDLNRYKETNGAFRKLSYHIYTLPEIETTKEEVLFSDLMGTTALVAESRQKIKELLNARLSSYSWLMVMLMLTGFVLTVILTAQDSLFGRLIAGVDIAIGLMLVDLLWELDTMNTEVAVWAKRYVDNMGKLEFGERRRE